MPKAKNLLGEVEPERLNIGGMWCDCYRAWQNTVYKLTGRDQAALKQLYSQWTAEEANQLKSKMIAYLKDPCQARWNWSLFSFEICQNNYQASVMEAQPGEAQDDAGFLESLRGGPST